jgi:hypothetical protein
MQSHSAHDSTTIAAIVSEVALDTTLIAATCLYAAWLDEHKDLEPDHTWLEVVGGVALCLAQADCQARWGHPDYRRAVWRAFALGGTPIIVSELLQWRRRVAERRRYARTKAGGHEQATTQ